MKAWTTKEIILTSIKKKSLFDHFLNQLQVHAIDDCKNMLYEITTMILTKEIQLDSICEALQILKINTDLQDTICECLWMAGNDWSKKDAMSSEAQTRYASLVRYLINNEMIEAQKLLERLDEVALAACGLIKDHELFMRKRVRIRTKLYYDQQKFNLLREESEGFSKIVAELSLIKLNSENVSIVLSNIQSLIGYHDLDPNRVLDLILEIYEKDSSNELFIELIKNFNRIALPQILGYKLQNEDLSNNPSFFSMTASLINAKLFSVAQLWPYLNPEDKAMEKAFQERLNLASSIAKQVGRVKLLSSDSSPTESKQNVAEFEKQLGENQKIQLMDALVKINAWDKVEEIYYLMCDSFDVSCYQFLLQSVFELTHWVLDPIYSPISYEKFVTQDAKSKTQYKDQGIPRATDFHIFYSSLKRILKIIGVEIAQDSLLYTKICRIIKSSLNGIEEFKEQAYILCETTLVPSLALVKCNPGICFELWEILKEFNYSERYSIYNHWLNIAYYSCPRMILQYALRTKEIRKWLKRLAKTNIRQYSKLLGKISHSNPCLLFDIILTQIRSYENQIQSIVSALSNCSPLGLDIVAYNLLRQISDTKEKMEPNGDIVSWFSNLSVFAGCFFRKYYWVDSCGLFHYICGKLLASSYAEAAVLSEVIGKMTGYLNLDLDKMTEKQFEAMAGGKTLQVEALGFSADVRRAKKSASALAKLFFHQTNLHPASHAEIWKTEIVKSNAHYSLALTIDMILGQVIQGIMYRPDSILLKADCNIFDRLRSLFFQLNQFLSDEAESGEFVYEQLLPPSFIPVAVTEHHLPPEIVFHLMSRSIKPLYEYSEGEFMEIIECCKTVLNCHLQNCRNNALIPGEDKKKYMKELDFVKERESIVWKAMSPELYAFFWLLKLQDIHVPKERYEEELARATSELSSLQAADSRNATEQSQKKIDRLKLIINNLKNELARLTDRSEKYHKFLESRRDKMIEHIVNKDDLNTIFLQYCIYPRMIISPSEALYSMRILLVLYKIKVQYINIVKLIEILIKRMLPSIQCCTEKEAYNFGIFFLEVFKSIQYYCQDESIWRAECMGYPGFSINIGSTESIKYSDFKNIIHKISQKVAHLLKKCLDSEEYMQARNSLIVLKKLIAYFPKEKGLAESIDKVLTKLISATDKDDLSVMAQRYKDILSKKMQEMNGGIKSSERRPTAGERKKEWGNDKSAESTKREMSYHKKKDNTRFRREDSHSPEKRFQHKRKRPEGEAVEVIDVEKETEHYKSHQDDFSQFTKADSITMQ